MIAFAIPSIAISSMLTGSSVPQIGFASSDISLKLNQAMMDLGQEAYTKPFTHFNQLNVFCITAALMFGTAGLPHVIVRFYTVKSVRAARYSAVWAIVFIALLYTTAPALGLFARYNLIKNLNGSKIESVEVNWIDGPDAGTVEQFAFPEQASAAQAAMAKKRKLESEAESPRDFAIATHQLTSPDGVALDWAIQWQRIGLLKLDDWSEDGSISLKLMETTGDGSSKGDSSKVLKSEMAHIDKDIIVLSTPEVAGLPPWVIALVAAGGLAAALSTAAGLLLVISSSLAHDLFVRYFAPHASETQRVMIGRIAIIFGIVVAGYFGINPPGFVGEVVAFAFGLAAASFFPVIFLGIFFKRANRAGAVSGMIVGLVFTLGYIVMCTADKVLPMFFTAPMLTKDQWLFGISPQGIGTFGMVLNFLTTITISLCTAPPPAEVMELIESVRVPKGSGEAVEH